MARWIKIDTGITDHWLWSDANKLKWWIDIIIMASYEKRQVLHDNTIVTLERGQEITSLRYLENRWNVSRPTVIKFLSLLEREGMISRKNITQRISVLTVCNYSAYQGSDKDVDHLDEESVDHSVDHSKNDLKHCITNSCEYPENTAVDHFVDQCVDHSVDQNIEYIDNISMLSSLRSDNHDTRVEKIDFARLLDYWNSAVDQYGSKMPKLRSMTERRKSYTNARLLEYGKQTVFNCIQTAMMSEYLNGRNPRLWIADFDWIMRPNNFIKIIEGNYDRKQQKTTEQRRGSEVTASSGKDYIASF